MRAADCVSAAKLNKLDKLAKARRGSSWTLGVSIRRGRRSKGARSNREQRERVLIAGHSLDQRELVGLSLKARAGQTRATRWPVCSCTLSFGLGRKNMAAQSERNLSLSFSLPFAHFPAFSSLSAIGHLSSAGQRAQVLN